MHGEEAECGCAEDKCGGAQESDAEEMRGEASECDCADRGEVRRNVMARKSRKLAEGRIWGRRRSVLGMEREEKIYLC